MNLKEIRKELNLTQVEVADRMGITQSAYSHWEKENRTPDVKTAKRLAEVLGVSVDRLLGIDTYTTTDDLIEFDVLGTIKAGYDGEAIEMPTGDKIPIPKQFLKGYRKEDYMVLRISGLSMFPKFLDGDYALIRKQVSVLSGDVACILYNGNEATIKTVRYVKGEDWLELVPANPEYPVKRLEGEADLQSCRILGKVVKLIRDI